MKDQLDTPNNAPAQKPAPPPVSANFSESGPGPTPKNGTVAPGRVVRMAPARRPAKRPAMAGKRPASRPTRPPRPAQPSHSTRPAQSGHSAHSTHSTHHYEKLVDEGDDGFFARHRAKFIFGIIALLACGAAYLVKTSKPAPEVKAAPQMVSIKLPPLPKPPPPPPPKIQPPPPPDQKMVAETQPVEKPQEAPKPVEKAPEALGTNLKGDGPGMAGLGGSGNGGGFGGPGGGGGGSKWGRYAGQVQSRVAEALRQNSKTKTASMTIQVRIWPDATGRVKQAKLDGTTKDPKLDEALLGTLNGLQLLEPPPPGMPTPIVLRLTARRP